MLWGALAYRDALGSLYDTECLNLTGVTWDVWMLRVALQSNGALSTLGVMKYTDLASDSGARRRGQSLGLYIAP